MIGVIDVGGGLRDIYGAGVFDRCLDDGILFDCCIGVSAGSANVASYLGAQHGRNRTFNTEYAFRKEYMGFEALLKTGSFIDLDYVYGTLSRAAGENPLAYHRIRNYPGILNVIATEAETGLPRYFTKADMSQDNYLALSASSSIPFVSKPVMINGVTYFDGGISDPVPIERALALGCERIVLILTKPADLTLDGRAERRVANACERRYPAVAAQLRKRAEKYNACVLRAFELQALGKCLIVAPDDTCGVGTISRSKDSLEALYQKGYKDGAAIKAYLQNEPVAQ
ncbi:MAG: patatin family protein [Clostridia bacterium]|nr:patatin family protein [Clostridia bacterium]